ncbi:hypothetical protein C0995_005905 [Termitomyces sp. Mi166|nr:hypothetical protein C0995_005905 [Termitomyces sp. Mi166\
MTIQVYSTRQNDSPCDPSSVEDDLDSVLRTSLWPHDPEFHQLACRRIAWWDSERIRTWFLERGYTLYLRYPSEADYAAGMYPLDANIHEGVFPYASHEGPKSDGKSRFPTLYGNTGTRGTIAFAQTTQGQHVAVKAILDGSEEFRVLKYLHNQGVPGSMDDFHHVIPVLDLLACEGHWLAVMPRWGVFPLLPSFSVLIELILTPLTGIDLSPQASHRSRYNILINHVNMDICDLSNYCRWTLRSQGKSTYALHDFDGSTMFPPSMSLDECRLPSSVSYNTLYDQVPGDTLQGELDFNPFAFDVGMLGVMFCQEFQHMTRTVPMLAPLFDRMTTRDIARRFKASEALQFFEEQVIPLTPKHVLSWAAEPIDQYDAYDYYDRWKYLDPDFVEKWAAYREPPVPRHIRILREMCLYPWVFRIVTSIRYGARFLCHGLSILSRILPWK